VNDLKISTAQIIVGSNCCRYFLGKRSLVKKNTRSKPHIWLDLIWSMYEIEDIVENCCGTAVNN